MIEIELLSTDGCHLCEQALGMFYYAKQENAIDESCHLKVSDIFDDSELVSEYGERIPVFRKTNTDDVLEWPFEYDQLVNWLTKS